MQTRKTIEGYLNALSKGEEWVRFLGSGMTFTSYTSPTKQVVGRDAYIESTKRFFSMVTRLELRQLIVDGARACASTRYQLTPPTGSPFSCDVAELFTVRDGLIDSLEIYFDSAPFTR